MSYKFFIILAVAFSLVIPVSNANAVLCVMIDTGQESQSVNVVDHELSPAWVKLPYGPKICYADGVTLEFIKDNFDGIRTLHHQVNPAQDDTIWTGDDAEFLNENL